MRKYSNAVFGKCGPTSSLLLSLCTLFHCCTYCVRNSVITISLLQTHWEERPYVFIFSYPGLSTGLAQVLCPVRYLLMGWKNKSFVCVSVFVNLYSNKKWKEFIRLSKHTCLPKLLNNIIQSWQHGILSKSTGLGSKPALSLYLAMQLGQVINFFVVITIISFGASLSSSVKYEMGRRTEGGKASKISIRALAM